MSEEILHVRELAEVVGPRPATTDAEARAADYIGEVFRKRGLKPERQDFLCPRTYSWTFVTYHLLTIAAAVVSGLHPVAAWIGAGVALLSAVLMWLDLDTRTGLSAVMPKGPSQNVIARHVPRARRGERIRRIVVVAHYDSARASLAFSPAMVRNFNLTFGLMKYITFLMPALLLLQALPLATALAPWLWYASMLVAAYLLVPTAINIHRELAMTEVDGANDNASGVAAMLGVMRRVVPEPEGLQVQERAVVRRNEEEAVAADVVPEEALLSYSPAGPVEPLLDESFAEDVSWDAPAESLSGQETMDFADEKAWEEFATRRDQEPTPDEEPRRHRKLFGRKRGDDEERRSIRDWLGVGSGFDAREEGRNIGSWENFEEEDEDLGFKGGRAPYDALDDPGFARDEASRIRRRITERIDRALADKEVWFVATGAEETGTWGMRSLLETYGEELREATIINIDNVGSGNVSWVTREGMARKYHADRRLASTAKRVSRERGLRVAPRVYDGLSTDATPALARGYKAMSVMAFDINGRLPNWHWKTDTVENVSEENIELATTFVTELIREL